MVRHRPTTSAVFLPVVDVLTGGHVLLPPLRLNNKQAQSKIHEHLTIHTQSPLDACFVNHHLDERENHECKNISALFLTVSAETDRSALRALLAPEEKKKLGS